MTGHLQPALGASSHPLARFVSDPAFPLPIGPVAPSTLHPFKVGCFVRPGAPYVELQYFPRTDDYV